MNFPELYSYVKRLKLSETNLQKGTGDSIRRIDSICVIDLEEENDNLDKLRENILHDLKKNVVDTIRSVDFIKSQLNNKNLLNINIKKMKKHMLTLETCTNLLKYKIIHDLDNLSKEERNLTIDVTNTEMKLNEFCKTKNEPIQCSNYAVKYINDHKLLKEVKDFLLFLNANGGHQGGWTSKDHAIFKNVYNKQKSKKHLMDTLLKAFPDMTKDKITDHINWYEKYTELGKIQKLAIEKWRENRNSKPKTPPECEISISQVGNKYKRSQNSKCNKIVKENIKKWQKTKLEKLEEEMMLKYKNSIFLKQKEQDRFMNNQKKKKQVEMWQISKLAQKETDSEINRMLEEKEYKRRMLQAKKLIKEYQNQDNEFVNKRMRKRKININPDIKKSAATEFNNKYKSNHEIITSLTKPTQSWLNKQKPQDDELLIKYQAIKTIQKLHSPEWRSAISDVCK